MLAFSRVFVRTLEIVTSGFATSVGIEIEERRAIDGIGAEMSAVEAGIDVSCISDPFVSVGAKGSASSTTITLEPLDDMIESEPIK